MPLGDPTFAKIDVDIFPNGDRFSTLPANAAFLYLALWCMAVKFRSDVIPCSLSTCKWIANWTHKDRVSVSRWLAILEGKNLIIRNADGSLIIDKVRACHKKLKWDKRPQIETGVYVHSEQNLNTHRGGESETPRVRETDLSTDPDSDLVSHQHRPAATPEPGAVDVKKLLEEADQESDRKRAEEKSNPSAKAENPQPWNQVDPETELEREVQLWFLQLWPHGEYDWETEKTSLMSQVRKHGRGPYGYARAILLEHRREGKLFRFGELAYLNGIAREQSKKITKGG